MPLTYRAATVRVIASQVLLPVGTGSSSSHVTNVEAHSVIPYLHLCQLCDHVRSHDDLN